MEPGIIIEALDYLTIEELEAVIRKATENISNIRRRLYNKALNDLIAKAKSEGLNYKNGEFY